jgi:pyruvate kinase
MKSTVNQSPLDAWDPRAADALIKELWSLRESMLARQDRLEPWLAGVEPAHQASAVNLLHYLALRRTDLRHLQDRLALMGVSSLGRAETHVLANVDKVLGILHRLAGRSWTPLQQDEPSGFQSGGLLLAKHAEALFGAPPAKRDVRIMVTLPSEAAHDDATVESLIAAGMDIARINCAHDGASEWVAMAARVRKLAARAGRPVRVLMDLGGPKLRTGPIAGAPAVVKLKPERDDFGRVTAPARLGLCPTGAVLAVAGAPLSLSADAGWLERLKVDDRIDLTDARGADRRLKVIHCHAAGVLVECDHTVYLTSETKLRLHRRGHHVRETVLGDIPVATGQLHLQRGEMLHLGMQGVGHDAVPGAKGRRAKPATIACTLPEALAHVRKGERIWFDDGRIGGKVRSRSASRVVVEITEARDGGEHLAADKGINLPDTQLELPALTPKDLADLEVVARHADAVGLSFAQSAGDVRTLRSRLAELGAGHLGLILKIETRRGFEHLPEMLLAAMAGPAAGVMIARGDLAVECGYERMAEVQEEILWACEAAHMPVVWATQVLETLAKTGLPSRAEITDAAMGGRAECVMLNKGPHILDAMRTLDDILRRMQAHQSKKRPLLRALTAWNLPLDAVELASREEPTGAQT